MSTTTKHELGYKVNLTLDYENALEKVTAALKVEGFGVLTEIDVKETLRKKIDVDFRPYKILGTCNPPLAHKALEAAPDVGMLLPCNVTVSQEEDGILVSIVNPYAMLGVINNPVLEEVAAEAATRLQRVAKALEG